MKLAATITRSLQANMQAELRDMERAGTASPPALIGGTVTTNLIYGPRCYRRRRLALRRQVLLVQPFSELQRKEC